MCAETWTKYGVIHDMWFWTLPFAANMMKNMKRNPTNPSISNDQMGGGEWSNRGRIVRSQLWQKLWRKIFFLRHFHKIHAPQVPIMCPTWQLQWIFFSGSASELKIPLLKGFVPPTHFQEQVGWWNWLLPTMISNITVVSPCHRSQAFRQEERPPPSIIELGNRLNKFLLTQGPRRR